MRVLAVFLPTSPAAGENVPCHRKNPMTKAGNVQSSMILQEIFISYRPLDIDLIKLMSALTALYELQDLANELLKAEPCDAKDNS
jgi:hypothetical protein